MIKINQIFYTVQRGDTLYQIASRWDIPLENLIIANNLKAPYTIYPGVQLTMPPGVNCYRVKEGDSIYSISKFFKIPMKVIIEANNLQPPYLIQTDDVINVPSGVDYYIVQTGDKLKIPYFLPFGRGKIAFTSLVNGKYNIMSFDFQTKQTSVLISQFVVDTSIPYKSRDGKKLAFIGENNRVYVYSEGNKEILTLGKAVEYSTIGWSHDSKKLVYVSDSYINIYDTNTKRTSTIGQPNSSYPQWFPGGEELLIQSPDSSGIKQLYRIKEDGSGKKQIGNNIWDFYNNVRLSPDGTFILYTTPSVSVSIIFTLEISTGKIHQIPSGPQGKDYNPRWSPDSTRIIFSSTDYRPGSYFSQINIAERQGINYQTYAVSNCFSSQACWLDDNERIVYLRDCNACAGENEAYGMWMVDLKKPVPLPVVSGINIVYVQE